MTHAEMPAFDIVLANEYAAMLQALAKKAKKRIVLTAMTVRAGEASGEVLQAFIDAARRGVKVHIVVDVYCQHAVDRPDYLSHHEFRQECARTREMLNEIQALGGVVDWVGGIGLNPYAGRHHVKATIIDDDVFSFGGINLCDDALDSIDYMLHATNIRMADRLENIVTDQGHGAPAIDVEMPLSAADTLLFDVGKKGRSLIYERACELALKSRKITYISQMCPTGRLSDVLKQTEYVCYFNNPAKHGLHPAAIGQLWDNKRTRITNSYEGNTYIHAKCMLFELNDGTKTLLSGSHNFSWRGVAFGTKEIALQSTDPIVWRRLQDIVYTVATAGVTR